MIKRLKHAKACSLCRRKKIRCDASERPDLRCSKCAMYGVECQYDYDTEHHSITPVKRSEEVRRNTREGHPSQRPSYVETLERRLQAMEELLKKLRSDEETQLCSPTTIARSAPEPPDALPSYSAIRSSRLSLHDFDHASDVESSDEDSEGPSTAVGDRSRYYGKSSSNFLIRTIAGYKADGTSQLLTWSRSGYNTPSQHGSTPPPRDVVSDRPLFEELPPPDLLHKLVDAYFDEFNIYFPLLHRPTFDRCIQEGLHVRDDGFCAIVLLVCANGSRWVDDDRLQRNRGHPPGLHWFERAGRVSSVFLEKPSLYDLQALILTVAYMNGTDAPYGTWTVIGVGLRMAQDVGVHRKKTYSSTPTVDDELWRRAFWVLVAMDRMTSFGMGRPCAIQDEDFDVDPMTECDDEYWMPTDPTARAFEQPPGQPSKVAFANCLMRLLRVLAFALRTIYTTNKSKLLFGFVGPAWKQGVVAELDSALNRWMDTVPAHLRWDPKMQDPTFFAQSAALYASFYQAQICIHRPFLPSRRKPSLASLPSLAICTTAARACVRLLYTQHLRSGLPKCTLCSLLVPLHTAATLLVIALAAGKGKAREREVEEIAEEIGKCFEMLLSTEP
ncbi:hypothetical protein L227DRAFT_439478 [Lentinus tigrinus ALCF2SS1-6]|uniref:Zn(2)-C6 fungal-type domain-containing protein n=1 Tax=Lentinus tigrinus ALCF2SS1-6 TaxID=1328759 RepID=A0A5C2RMS4_9APHY|nr:hypothetical protein L227DRAFT_439478 [Lentinus tigrinus ALCF2SS1-6]